ncbi:LOW QUALITY PROTEIN: ABC transporter [Colletotrichum tofieldiae]|nr:LOW QUALITY PROTEIN: ABC transporter [Colletotrichum tofieldiae]
MAVSSGRPVSTVRDTETVADTVTKTSNSDILGTDQNNTSADNGQKKAKSDDGKTKKPGTLHYFFRVHWSYSTLLDHNLRLLGLIAAIGAGILPPIMTIVFGSSVNSFNEHETGEISGSELYRGMSQNALWLLYLFIGRFFLVYIHSTCFGLVGIRITKAFRIDFIRSMIRQDISFIDNLSPGTVSSTISNSADMVENGSTEKVGSLIQNISMFIAAFAVAFTQQWKLTLVTATTLPVLFIGFKITFGLDAKIEAEILHIYNRAGGLVEEALGTIRVVTAFNVRGRLSRKYDESLAAAQKLGFRKGPIIGIQWSVEFFTIYCAYALAWFYGIKLLNDGSIAGGGQIISVLLAVLLGTSAASNVAPGFGDFAKASAAAQGMFEMIDRKSDIDPLADTGDRPPKFNSSVELRNVSFAYPSRPSVPVLNNPGVRSWQSYGIGWCLWVWKKYHRGLVERWFDPTSGTIHVGGHNVADLHLRWLRGQIGLVQQEPVLFRDTIYNNVVHGLYGSPMDDLPEPEKRELVRQACIQAFADDFIQELPQKYDTKVGDRGALLSGGQKQRIAIARSVISNPPILLLDEATSALDPTAERKVQASLDNVSKSRTTIMIAHKLSTVQKADKIVVLSRGEVIEQGSHQQLLDLGDVAKAHSAANHILDLRASQPPINTSTGIKALPASGEESAIIELRDVTFAYPSRPDHLALNNLNLKIGKGQSVGIVGASGCGKSTIIGLLERFYDVTSGQLLIEGRQLQDLDVHHHRSRVGLVSQETMLFQGSISDNILLGLPDDEAIAPNAHERVERACRSANMHDFISSLPEGYATDIGNRGVALSGGQRQRLAIARALIREPDILLFDEATSALDTANEALVQAAIEAVTREKPGRTTIAVAHRLSTIQRCDRIFVLHKGQVVEEGTHHELFHRRGQYYEMVLAQSLDREVVGAQDDLP